MKTNKYSVYFTDISVEVVNAFSLISAVIIACARRCEKGQHIECSYVCNQDTGERHKINPAHPIAVNFLN